MNRIILIGNGFDLAHGLKTKYKDFIDDYWTKKVENIVQNGNYNCFRKGYTGTKNNPIYEDEDIRIMKVPYADNTLNVPEAIHSFFDREEIIIDMQYKNYFLGRIMIAYKDKNWGGIEDEYYTMLKECITKKDKDEIEKLNQDFKIIKEALIEYLSEETAKNDVRKNEKIEDKIYSEFKLKDFTDTGRVEIIKEEYEKFQSYEKMYENPRDADVDYKTYLLLNYCSGKDYAYFRKTILDDKDVCSFFHLLPKQILFLNFNYVDTENKYSDHHVLVPANIGIEKFEIKIEKEIIHIHGDLKDNDNPIIFGYGDEIGKEYMEIENLNDNRFLENVKSIKYLETDNYKRLLSFIDSDKYQIFIMGHSCSISDRTLLTKLFEHDNCISIKVFFHDKKDGTDDYSNVIRNISRNFTDKSVMREKVVNRMDSKSLS